VPIALFFTAELKLIMTRFALAEASLFVIREVNQHRVLKMAADALRALALVDPVRVAFAAFKQAVGTAQREVRHAVLKLWRAPELLDMAALAVGLRAEVDVVLLVADLAVVAGAAELAIVGVALIAVEQPMHASQDKVLVEAGRCAPSGIGMAGRTLRSKTPSMRVFMTQGAVLGEQALKDKLAFGVMR
jgi:hypothetical protein